MDEKGAIMMTLDIIKATVTPVDENGVSIAHVPKRLPKHLGKTLRISGGGGVRRRLSSLKCCLLLRKENIGVSSSYKTIHFLTTRILYFKNVPNTPPHKKLYNPQSPKLKPPNPPSSCGEWPKVASRRRPISWRLLTWR